LKSHFLAQNRLIFDNGNVKQHVCWVFGHDY
jgi:hypothetical protein